MVRKMVKELDLGAEPPHAQPSREAPPPRPLWSMESVNKRAQRPSYIFAVADVVT